MNLAHLTLFGQTEALVGMCSIRMGGKGIVFPAPVFGGRAS